jgi:GT2 family glycosyltransferase
MILSVIIVSFNVKYFLEQCLCSLKRGIDQSTLLSGNTEVFVVDNASTDGSVAFLQPLYPSVHFIQNTQNHGFARANNQALPQCRGSFVLFLNPDTILAEDSLEICVSFLMSHPRAGAAGVRMIDGSGRFLKESKRGFPGPRASFFKMSGMASVFPGSRFFAAYYAGHLDPHRDHPVEILSGACMMVRKTALDQTGGFDEQFFMYAEDIDLSYRIRRAGYQNYYLAATCIIHFKGESTQKDIRYIGQFHLAMDQFARKYFRGSPGSRRFSLLNSGIAVKQRISMLWYSIKEPIKKRAGRSTRNKPVFIKGDSPDLPLVISALEKAGRQISDTASEAGSLIYCAGEQKTLKSIIREMDESSRKLSCYIHIEGTHAIAGSLPGKEKDSVISW